jgi:hypothetical protein
VPLESVEHPAEQGQGPVALEQPLGGPVVGRLVEEPALGVAGVARQGDPTAAALLGAVAVAPVGEEEAAVGQQERAEPAPDRVGRRDGALLQQAREIILGQVEGALGVVPLAADEGVDRKPVRGAQLGQGVQGPRRVAVAGGDDPAPNEWSEIVRPELWGALP